MEIINKIPSQALEGVRLYGQYSTRVYIYKRRIVTTIYGKVEVIKRIYKANWSMRTCENYWETVYQNYVGGNGYETD